MKQHPIEKVKLKELQLELPKTHLKVCCPACDTETPSDNININDKIAKCGECNAVFPFHEELSILTHPSPPNTELQKPEGVAVTRFKNEMEWSIQQPFSDYDTWLMLFPSFAFLSGEIWLLAGKNILMWPTIILLLLTIYAIYNWSTRKKHHIRINANDNFLSFKWTPKKFQKEKVIPIQNLEQLYVKGTHKYSICAIINDLDGQKHITLIKGIKSQSKAKYLEQEIEKYLDIPNRPVNEKS